MNKRVTIFASLGIILALAALAVFLEPTRTVIGYLRGDAFYQGRSTSYWRRVLAREDASALQSAEALPVLAELLNDQHPEIRARAASILSHEAVKLGEMGPAASESVPALLKSLKDAKGNLDSNMMEYLTKVAEMKRKHPDAEIRLEFTAELDAPETTARYTVAEALKKIDPAAAKQAGLP
jgi:HEAT repeat protein